MFVPFDQLPTHSRIWIYPAERLFSANEKKEIEGTLHDFIDQWQAHGQNLKASFLLPYDHFIVIGLDENVQPATGCSIDASVHMIQQLEQHLKLTLLDKMNVCFRPHENQIEYLPLKDFRKLAKTPKVNPNTVVFNNLVVNKAEFEHHWEVPAHASWHARFIKG